MNIIALCEGVGGIASLAIGGAMLPAVVVVPTGVCVMLFLAGHVMAVVRSSEPESRKRIRASNGIVMMLGTALIVTGVSLLDPERQTGLWVLCWVAACALIWFAMVMAALDAANTYRLSMVRRRVLRAHLREALRESHERLRAQRR
ncbi:MAG: hypothetical protein ACTS3F_14150 [Phycisphaerales bacterium]